MRNALLLIVLGLLAALLCGACAEQDGDQSDPQPQARECAWSWGLEGGELAIDCGEREMLRIVGVERSRFAPDVSMLFGQFTHKKLGETVEQLHLAPAAQGVDLVLDGERVGAIGLENNGRGDLRVQVRLDDGQHGSSIKLACALNPADEFWGFGEQYNFVDFRGRSVPAWVSEQGLGRKPDPLLPFAGDLTDSYFPMPYFMDPRAGKGLLLLESEYALFDLGESDPDAWSLEVWNGAQATLLLFNGPDPADVVSQLTAEVGRPQQAPPDWAFSGVWLAAQGGTAAVRERLLNALEAGIPVSALWVQDWVGERKFGLGNSGVKYRWVADEQLYPGLAELIQELAAADIRFLGYFNPFAVPAYQHWDEMVEQGFLITRGTGQPYKFPISVFSGSLLDVTNPQAAAYFQGYAQAAAQMGQAGWMCDFGEWLPFDAALAGAHADSYHNLYPSQWHRLNREALDANYPDGDYVLLTRSGYTYEQQVAQIVWAGDQQADWDEYDGLPTVVTAGLTLGLSGVPFFTHDIAGFSGGPSTKELFMRWTELGAFTPVMRTHDGLQKDENHRFDSDPETLDHFRRCALIHAALLPYFKQLAQEAVQSGLPLVRHTCLVDPQWPGSYKAQSQWMIGNDLLFAPVVAKGATRVLVFFPDGQWEHLLTGEIYQGRQALAVDAPLGAPAAFVRVGEPLGIAELVHQALE